MPIYMQVQGIAGNVHNVPGLPGGWIEVYSFQFGATNTGVRSGGTGAGEGKVSSVGEIVVTKPTDVVSPKLLQRCLTAAGQGSAVSLVFTNSGPGGPSGPRNKLNLHSAVIANIRPSPPKGTPGGPVTNYEELTFRFDEYDLNGAKNAPLPYALIRPLGL